MFETISGTKQRERRSRIALATALGLHAAALGGALLYAHFHVGEAIAPVTNFDQLVIYPPRPRVSVESGRTGVQPQAPVVESARSKRKPPTPRAAPSEPASVPIEPEQIAAPATDVSRASEEMGQGSALGSGDAGNLAGAEGVAGACPRGAVCTSLGGEQVLLFSSAMTPPRPACDPPAPTAPAAAREYGIEGRVVAQYVVHADGRADAVNVLNGDAPPIYAEAVRAWVERCTFSPSQLDGEARSVRVVQTFHFKSR